MSRCTQFIGLTRRAEKFVSNLKQLPSDATAHGMFPDDDQPLRRWETHPLMAQDDRPNACIREVVQCEPWSSGPMIFTCLEMDFGNGSTVRCLQWIDDPALSQEFAQHRADERWGLREDGSGFMTVIGGDEYNQEEGTLWV